MQNLSDEEIVYLVVLRHEEHGYYTRKIHGNNSFVREVKIDGYGLVYENVPIVKIFRGNNLEKLEERAKKHISDLEKKLEYDATSN